MSEKKAKRGRGSRLVAQSREQLPSSSGTSAARGFAAVNQSPGTSNATQRGSPTQRETAVSFSPTSLVHAPPERAPSSSATIPPGKVPIPAIRRDPEPVKRPERKVRTTHACDNCRRAKAGCSGGQPCLRCKNTRAQCVYGDGKRDRERKRITKLSRDTTLLSQYTSEVNGALRHIRDDTSLSVEDLRTAINGVLAMTPRPLSPDDGEMSASALASGRMSSADRDDEDRSENEVEAAAENAAEQGSTGSMDAVELDADTDATRATGHLGKSSAVAWAQRTAEEVNSKANATETVLGERGYTLSSYHTEDADIEDVDTEGVDLYTWPDNGTSDFLLEIYWDHVHNAFPAIEKRSFLESYREFPRGSSHLSRSQKIWLGTMNTVWAISSVFARLTKKQYRGLPNDHLFYIAKAKKLSRISEEAFEDARVTTILQLGLLCLYYLCTDRLNRAWSICGLAIRQALAIGLHVRQEMKELSDASKEHRVRLWWSLYSLECSLNELTGRPTCISDRDISTPLPLNIDDNEIEAGQPLYMHTDKIGDGREPGTSKSSSEHVLISSAEEQTPTEAPMGPPPFKKPQPAPYAFPVATLPITSSTFFLYRTQLAIIAHETVTALYCPSTIKEKWHEVQATMYRIDYRLLAWRENLPRALNISFDTVPEPDWNDPYLLRRTGLAMLFTSSRMILFRPCLCRFEGRMTHQSAQSKEFNHDAVLTCIRSARKMISLIRWSSSSADKLYAIVPWWTTLHYLCEALSILMLEMAFQAQHVPEDASRIFEDAKKGVRWLALMSEESVSARKAWEIFDSLIRQVAPMVHFSADDLPNEAPVPPTYNWRRFNTNAMGQSATDSSELTSANLQQYTRTQSPLPHKQATTDWANVGQGSVFDMRFSDEPMDTLPNPLDPSTALQCLHGISGPHGLYDEPWYQFFGNEYQNMMQLSQPQMNMSSWETPGSDERFVSSSAVPSAFADAGAGTAFQNLDINQSYNTSMAARYPTYSDTSVLTSAPAYTQLFGPGGSGSDSRSGSGSASGSGKEPVTTSGFDIFARRDC